MKGWLIYSKEGAVKNKEYIEFHLIEGKRLGMDIKLILTCDIEFGIKDNVHSLFYKGNKIEEKSYPTFVICRTIYPLLSKQIELMGIRVFNKAFIARICNDKAKTHQYLAKTGIPMVDSSFVKNEQLKDVLEKVKSQVVIKAVEGHGGSQVFLLKPFSSDHVKFHYDIKEIIKGIGSSDAVIQPLIGTKHQDLRVYVIGDEIIASVLRTSKEGFKSNFSLGGEVSLYDLSRDETKLINKIIKEFSFDFVGIDFLIGDHGELIFNEIEDVVGSRMLYHCSDINIVKLYLEYISKNIWMPGAGL